MTHGATSIMRSLQEINRIGTLQEWTQDGQAGCILCMSAWSMAISEPDAGMGNLCKGSQPPAQDIQAGYSHLHGILTHDSSVTDDAGMRQAAGKQPASSPAGKRGPVADGRAQRYSDHEDSIYSEAAPHLQAYLIAPAQHLILAADQQT